MTVKFKCRLSGLHDIPGDQLGAHGLSARTQKVDPNAVFKITGNSETATSAQPSEIGNKRTPPVKRQRKLGLKSCLFGLVLTFQWISRLYVDVIFRC